MPKKSDRYFRGLVFYKTNKAGKWSSVDFIQEIKNNSRLKWPKAHSKIKYKIILEPHDEKWLFALDLPTQATSNSKYLADFTLRSHDPITNRKLYYLESGKFEKNLTPLTKNLSSGLPSAGNPKSRELAKSWKSLGISNKEIISKAIDFYKDNQFTYTLSPPLLAHNKIDDFLFRTKSGYCEHYASSFAFLMRSVGIPTRLVGGYVGGEENPLGNYLILRQSDAHVWAEVWLEDKGWTRIDPTEAAAPTRITQGLESSIPQSEIPYFFSKSRMGNFHTLYKNIQLRFDMINFSWNKWVMSYDHSKQTKLFRKLKISTDNLTGILKIILIILLFLGISFFLATYIKLKKTREDKIAKRYRKFLRKVKKNGLSKPSYMGPKDFSELAKQKIPNLKEEIENETKHYINSRFT